MERNKESKENRMKIMPYLVYPQIPRMPMQPSIPKPNRDMSRKCAEKVHAHRNARTKASENRAAKKEISARYANIAKGGFGNGCGGSSCLV